MIDENDLGQPHPHSHLFTVRVWCDTGQADEATPYMQVKHVLSGETRYFSTWPPLIAYLLSKLDRPPVTAPSSPQ